MQNDRYNEFDVIGNRGLINPTNALLNFEILNMRQPVASNRIDLSPEINTNYSNSQENESRDALRHNHGVAFDVGGYSLNMPMGLPDNQMSFLNPNNRAQEEHYNSTGV